MSALLKDQVTVTISAEARILLAHEALSFQPGDWHPGSITRHLVTQNKLALNHLQEILNHNTCSLTEDLKNLLEKTLRQQQQIDVLTAGIKEATQNLSQNYVKEATAALNIATTLRTGEE
ncbi:hypothetical protein [Aliamphritea hakodatensis]|uniref:hypothetical protein n=1 Tax=Aliamphritea hakodatensis TaxID=2895352 RepID=UPI0022FD8138|nr:hypothetical protein [Aliamphritea hakodatensis]